MAEPAPAPAPSSPETPANNAGALRKAGRNLMAVNMVTTPFKELLGQMPDAESEANTPVLRGEERAKAAKMSYRNPARIAARAGAAASAMSPGGALSEGAASAVEQRLGEVLRGEPLGDIAELPPGLRDHIVALDRRLNLMKDGERLLPSPAGTAHATAAPPAPAAPQNGG